LITYKINGVKHHFPTQWADLTYSQYVALLRSTTLTDQIHIFTGIPKEVLENAELRNLEQISLTLSFLSFSPKFEKTKMVGHYFVPEDVTIQSTKQLEDLKGLLRQMPKDLNTIENAELIADLYLTAVAIYCQKLRDGKYNPHNVESVKEELKGFSCAEVCGTGAFFLFKPWPSLKNTTTRFQRITQHLKRWSQGLPGYQKISDLFQRFTPYRVK
jgi:hypothetical protein